MTKMLFDEAWPFGESRHEPSSELLSIAAVARDTGLSRDTLRVWERRYGFPQPERDAQGERVYPAAQLLKLRLLKRLLDAGHRPGRVVSLSLEELGRLAEVGAAPVSGMASPPGPAQDTLLREALDALGTHDPERLRRLLTQSVVRLGLAGFVLDLMAPLTTEVGKAWMRGQLQVHEEHLYTEVVQGVLRAAMAGLPPAAADSRPRVLLSTLPGEPHGLGLLMVEALLALEGCRVVSLGVQTPLHDIVQAAAAQQADLVGLSFTACLAPAQVLAGVAELRAALPVSTALWVGGAAPALQRRPPPGVTVVSELRRLPSALRDWRAAG